MTAPAGPQPPRSGRSIALVDWTAVATSRVARLIRPVVAAAAPASVARHARHRTPTLGISMLRRGQTIARRAANRRAASFRPEARLVLRRRIVPLVDTEPRFSMQRRPPAAVIETPETPRLPVAPETGEPAAPRPSEPVAAPPPEATRPAPPLAPSLIVRAARTVGRLFRGDGGDSGDGGSAPPSGEPSAVADVTEADTPASETAPPPIEADTAAPETDLATVRPDEPARLTEAPSEVDLVLRQSAASTTVEQSEARAPDAPVAREVERDAEPAPAEAQATETPSRPRADATPEPVAPVAAPPLDGALTPEVAPQPPTPPARPSLVTRIARRVRLASADEPAPAAPAAPVEPPRLDERAEPPALDRTTPEAPAEDPTETLAAPAPTSAPTSMPVVAREPATRAEPAPLSLVRRVARRVGLERGAPEPAPAPLTPLPRSEATDAPAVPSAPVSPPSPIAPTPEREIAPPRTVLRETEIRETESRETEPGERPAAPPLIGRAAAPRPAAAPATPVADPGTPEAATSPATPPPLGVLSVVPPPRTAVAAVPSIARIYRRRPTAQIAAPPQPSTDPGTFDASALARAIDAGNAPAEVIAAVEGHALDAVPTSAQGYAVARATGGPVAFPTATASSGTLHRVAAPAQEQEAATAPDIDLDSLARQVFSRLRGRLLRERERHGLGYRWR